jgi:hypothetical protein
MEEMQSTDAAIRYLGDLQTLQVGPDDIFVISTEKRMLREQMAQIVEMVSRVLKTRKVVVLTEGLTLGKVTTLIESSATNAVIGGLMTFYGADSVEGLVEAQARHIEKLQLRLPPNDQPTVARVREG